MLKCTSFHKYSAVTSTVCSVSLFSHLVSFISVGNSILHEAADSVSSAVQKASQALNERGERLGHVEEKTGQMMNSAQHFAETAHKVKFGLFLEVF